MRRRPGSLARSALLLLVSLIASSVPSLAQELAWDVGVRPRTEARSAGEVDLFFSSMRTQLGLAAAVSSDVRLYVQLQDARFWGGATVFDRSADAFDLYRGYFELGHQRESVLWTRVGRQTMDYANGRLIGDPEWSQYGRSFDGVRTTVRLGDRTWVDGFGMQLRESSAILGQGDATLWGIWGGRDFEGGGSLELFVIHDRDGTDPETQRSTLGLFHDGALGPLGLVLEGAWQTGRARGQDLEGAYLAAGALTLPLADGRGAVVVGYDRYSGAANPDEGTSQAFSDLFGRNHRFLGFADLFFDIPSNTGGRGLQDLRTQLRWPLPWAGRVEVALHHFTVVDAGGLESGTLADEVDFTFLWPRLFDGALALQAGASWAELGGAGEALPIAPGDVLFGYVMLEVALAPGR